MRVGGLGLGSCGGAQSDEVAPSFSTTGTSTSKSPPAVEARSVALQTVKARSRLETKLGPHVGTAVIECAERVLEKAGMARGGWWVTSLEVDCNLDRPAALDHPLQCALVCIEGVDPPLVPATNRTPVRPAVTMHCPLCWHGGGGGGEGQWDLLAWNGRKCPR